MDTKTKILDMVKEGKISTEDALKLLEGLDKPKEESKSSPYSSIDPQWLKIRAIDKDGNIFINLAFPLSIISIGFKFISQLSPEIKTSGLTEEDLDSVFEAVKNGITGKILDIKADDGSNIEIVIE